MFNKSLAIRKISNTLCVKALKKNIFRFQFMNLSNSAHRNLDLERNGRIDESLKPKSFVFIILN